MSYDSLFKSVLLEFAEASPNPNVLDGDADEAFENQLDPDTDSEAFLTQGIKDTFDRVQADFNQKMSAFAAALSPEAVKRMPLGVIQQKVSKVYDYVNNIQVYAKAKIDALSQNPNGILAAFIASEPSKQAAFEELHKRLKEFVDTIEETITAVSGLKGKIDSFIENIAKADGQSAAATIAAQQQAQGSPTGGGEGASGDASGLAI